MLHRRHFGLQVNSKALAAGCDWHDSVDLLGAPGVVDSANRTCTRFPYANPKRCRVQHVRCVHGVHPGRVRLWAQRPVSVPDDLKAGNFL